MELQSLKLVYFSPTGTTRKIVQRIAEGMDFSHSEDIDLTRPANRIIPMKVSESDLLLIGVPVYMGRVPAVLNEWLENLKATNAPVAFVAVYGNRTCDNALLELKDLLENAGCVSVAAASFIGEHSFSHKEFPIAEGRPDSDDLQRAFQFGQQIRNKLFLSKSVESVSILDIPGNYPYGGVTELWSVDFIEISDECTGRGICAEVCPVGAINLKDTRIIDIEKCISCCACIKSCPQNARTIKESRVKDASIRLHNLFKKPKQPEVFL